MPDQRITICVIALTQADFADIEPDAFRVLLATPPPFYDFNVPGRPYALAPDDWRPFGGNDTVTQLIEAAGLTLNSMSIQLFDPAASVEARDKTELYIIDPLVLMHRAKRNTLRYNVQERIQAAKRAFCIILPSDVPQTIRDELKEACSRDLNDLFRAWLEVDVWEWEVEKPLQLHKFLRRVAKHFSAKGDPSAMAIFFQKSNDEFGTPRVTLAELPRMVGK